MKIVLLKVLLQEQCFTTSFEPWNSGFKPWVSTPQPTAIKILDAHSLTIHILRSQQQLSVQWTTNNLEKLQKKSKQSKQWYTEFMDYKRQHTRKVTAE
jgi:hypothetical protein